MEKDILIFSGEASDDLAKAVCSEMSRITRDKDDLSTRYVECKKRDWFNERAPAIQLGHLRDAASVIFVQSLMPMDSCFVQLCAMIDAAVRASAQRIIVVMPYFPGRQDKKDAPWTDITAAWVLPALEERGGEKLERFISFDLHSGQIQGYAKRPFDHLTTLPVLISHLKREHHINLSEVTLVSPDAGGVKRVRDLSRMCKTANSVIIDKERLTPGENIVREVIGNPGPVCVIVDDIGDTLGTIVEAAKAIKKKNDKASVYALLSHAVLGGEKKRERALDNIRHEAIDHLVVSDTVRVPDDFLATGKVSVVSVAPILASALERILTGGSINEMLQSLSKRLDL